MSDRYVAVISASPIFKYVVKFFDGRPVPNLGNSERYGWANEVKFSGHDTFWGAALAARRGVKYLDRMDRLNKRLSGGTVSSHECAEDWFGKCYECGHNMLTERGDGADRRS